MTPTTPTKKPRKKPRKQPAIDFNGWKIRKIAEDVWQSDNMGKFWHKDERTGKMTKKRERHYHESEEAAKQHIKDRQAEYNAHGAGATALTAVQRAECSQAYSDLAGRATIAQAVRFWMAHHPDGQAATLKEMVAAWMDEQTKNRMRPGTIKLNRQRLDALMRAMGDNTPCASITTQALKDYLDGLDCAPVTRNGARRCLRAFFQYCVDAEIMEANPVAKIKPAALDAKMPDFMTDKAVESFMNELANLSEALGADIEMVRQGIGSDPRIGYHFLYPGCGYGGSCFPKDVKALIKTAQDDGDITLKILTAVEEANNAQKHILTEKLTRRFGDLKGKHLALWGLAFKPNTDDMRGAPSRVLIADLLAAGATVTAYDPVAMPEAKRIFGDTPGLTYAESPMTTLNNADALVIVTEWKEFRSPDFEAIKTSLRTPVIFDGRNLYDPKFVRSTGIEYLAIGR